MSASLIRSFGQQIPRRRDQTPETRVKGKRVPDVFTEATITASVQPMRPDEIVQALGASAERNREHVKVYSFDLLKTVDVKAQLKADRIVYCGDEYECVQILKYQDNRMSIEFYKAICAKVNIERVKT